MKRKPSTSVGSFAAKTHFSSLLERVASGDVIEITRRGVPVARMVPIMEADEASDAKQALQELRQFAKGRRLGKVSVREMIEEGRRY